MRSCCNGWRRCCRQLSSLLGGAKSGAARSVTTVEMCERARAAQNDGLITKFLVAAWSVKEKITTSLGDGARKSAGRELLDVCLLIPLRRQLLITRRGRYRLTLLTIIITIASLAEPARDTGVSSRTS